MDIKDHTVSFTKSGKVMNKLQIPACTVGSKCSVILVGTSIPGYNAYCLRMWLLSGQQLLHYRQVGEVVRTLSNPTWILHKNYFSNITLNFTMFRSEGAEAQMCPEFTTPARYRQSMGGTTNE